MPEMLALYLSLLSSVSADGGHSWTDSWTERPQWTVECPVVHSRGSWRTAYTVRAGFWVRVNALALDGPLPLGSRIVGNLGALARSSVCAPRRWSGDDALDRTAV